MTASNVSVPDFELPNVGIGPDPLALDQIAKSSDFAVLLFLRDYHCPKCRAQVASMTDAADEFNSLNAAVLPILPEPKDRVSDWKAGFDGEFPFPLLADGDKRVAEAYDQPTQYGALGSLHDLIGRLPQSLVLDTRGDEPEIMFTHRGESAADRPSVDRLLEEVQEVRQSFVFDCSLVDC